jgi:ABC-type transport system involved in cytochrome c biogenesis permease subunit
MSTTDLGRFDAASPGRTSASSDAGVLDLLRVLVAPFASLKLTVTLLGLSFILVLAGTLAQVDHDVWYVVHSYFRTWIAWIELRIFFPRAWGISDTVQFPFPGGKLLGVFLAANLLAAHAVRFKVAAHGQRLWLGWATIALGVAITWGVIVSGSNSTVESELSPGFVNGLWHILRASLGGAALTLCYVLALTWAKASQSAARWLWWLGAVTALLLAALAAYLFMYPAARLDASGLRILWQLAKAVGAAVVLGAGCWAVFSKRAGIVLLHSGIGLLMFSELYTAEQAVEGQMTIAEGETAYWAQDIRSVELALTDASDDDVDSSTVVPQAMIEEAFRTGEIIRHRDLPVAVRVVKFLPNADWRWLQPGEEPVANAGFGQLQTVEERQPSTGVETEQTVDIPAACVELLSTKNGKEGESLGTYLISPLNLLTVGRAAEVVGVDGKPWELALRFRRLPKPYEVTLIDFKFDRYIGTDTAKNFESRVQFEVPQRGIDREVSIWMNNPLRYGGDTLYQADWDRKTEAGTVLQVVTNAGWMVPYVSCVIVGAGMLVHFLQGIIRFIYRREDEARRVAVANGPDSAAPRSWLDLETWVRPEALVPMCIVLVFAAWTLYRAMPPRESFSEMKIHQFGELPVVYGGRTQPIDSVARNLLRLISRRATYEDARFDRRQPAIRWLLDVASQSPDFLDHRVIRIENLEVLDSLGLRRRKGFCYSLAEVLDDEEEFARQYQLARDTPEEKRDLAQAKFLELAEKVQLVKVLKGAFGPAAELAQEVQLLLRVTKALDDGEIAEGAKAKADALLHTTEQRIRDQWESIEQLRQIAPLPVPPTSPDGPWQTVMEADGYKAIASVVPEREVELNEAAESLLAILRAYAEDDAPKFNDSVAEYQDYVRELARDEEIYEAELAAAGDASPRKSAERLDLGRIRFEEFFNQLDPFILCLALYIVAFVLAVAAWLGWFEGFNRTANWLLWFTFALHTLGLVCRIYISGRPPMTNLYSSAVFIGWAGVGIALVFEAVYRMGIGNVLAAVMGWPSMIIAYYLTREFANKGDTLGVMQAVLDTNFWLGTHVVCIGLGYATTLLAGTLGLLTIIGGYLLRTLDDDDRRQLTRMTYGTLCFAIFFSFIGTVLGGLWADDSWGRFWGWDPKENGALMIVIWNAIVLHARWGKIVGERGLASLVVLGNIVVAWSWWGVNQLGVGLHSYGKATGITESLTVFAIAMIAVVVAAYVEPHFRRPGANTS